MPIILRLLLCCFTNHNELFLPRSPISQVKKEAKFYFRYETPSTLLLRGILRRENPHHAAILDSFPETRREPPRNENTGSLVTEPNRIKRERNATGASSASAFRNVVNLGGSSHAPVDLGKDLICDLTGDDDAPPRWKKRQR